MREEPAFDTERSFLDHALELAARGFYVFPLKQNSKRPAITSFAEEASRDPEKIERWWKDPILGTCQPYNIGIFTGRFGEGEALVVVDLDVKNGKAGEETLISLAESGKTFPHTLTQSTPTGGKHFLYRYSEALKQGVSVLGPGLDIRSRGGYIVGAGSTIDGVPYKMNAQSLEETPPWIVEACGAATVGPRVLPNVITIDQGRAVMTVTSYLKERAGLSKQGEGGDERAFKVAAQCKDYGVDEGTCLELMLAHWNPRCDPPWAADELAEKVKNAYRYGENDIGVATPEAQFADVEVPLPQGSGEIDLPGEADKDPIDRLNSRYAYVVIGGKSRIMEETLDYKGREVLNFLPAETFADMYASQTMLTGEGKLLSVPQVWMRSKRRRSYLGVVFSPDKDPGAGYYNTWKGFGVPFPTGQTFPLSAHEAVESYLDHVLTNICEGERGLFNWMMSYLAQLIQQPGDKPHCALVLQGGKGVGKNVFIEIFGKLLGKAFLVTPDRNHLIGRFNSVLENRLMVVYDEAFWSGDKQAEGKLKSAITGPYIEVERKGLESYTAENLARIVIMGNEEWLVPASIDERRFAVFSVGAGKRNDRKFFGDMIRGMEEGGYSLLLKYFMEWELPPNAKAAVSAAPATKGLVEQKIGSFNPMQEWWHTCLTEGEIEGLVSFDTPNLGGWPGQVDAKSLYDAYVRFFRKNKGSGWVSASSGFSRMFLKFCPDLHRTRGHHARGFVLPSLDESRKAFAKYAGIDFEWPKEK